MLDRKIIAQNITNLTDARYFAAWGIEYVSFNMIAGSPYAMTKEDIEEIKEWLEGPRVLIETKALEFDELGEGLILDNIYSSMPLSQEVFFRTSASELFKGLPSGKYIIKATDRTEFDKILALNPSELQGLDIYLDITDLQIDKNDDLGPYGLVIQGGDEEKPGVKSFDELDDLYDLLLD
jgi:phosphoribosylanthranilate isomerase